MTETDSDLGDRLASVIARLNRWATQAADLPGPYAQMRLLGLIDAEEPVRISRLAALDRCSQPTMSALVKKLETAGWVERAPDPHDARAADLTLTVAGRAALRSTRVARGQAIDPALDRLGDQDRDRVRSAVDALEHLLRTLRTPEPAISEGTEPNR